MKLKSFTILELLIAMMLSAILFGMALGAFRLLNKQYIYYEKDSTQSLAQLHNLTLLERDIYLCQTFYQNQDSLVCTFADRTVVYVTRDSFWLRDVFRINGDKITDSLHFFRAKISLEMNTFFEQSNLMTPSRLILTWYPTTTDSIIWEYTKTYSSQDLWQKIPRYGY